MNAPASGRQVYFAGDTGYGTHTDEGIDDPPLELAAACERLGVSPEAVQVLETGETRLFNGQGEVFTSNTSSSSRINAGPR
jgi:hypothetical protein